jgi:hypothetical protein
MSAPKREQEDTPGVKPPGVSRTRVQAPVVSRSCYERTFPMIRHADPPTQVDRRRHLKDHLVSIGLRALLRNDMATVRLVDELLSGGLENV